MLQRNDTPGSSSESTEQESSLFCPALGFVPFLQIACASSHALCARTAGKRTNLQSFRRRQGLFAFCVLKYFSGCHITSQFHRMVRRPASRFKEVSGSPRPFAFELPDRTWIACSKSAEHSVLRSFVARDTLPKHDFHKTPRRLNDPRLMSL